MNSFLLLTIVLITLGWVGAGVVYQHEKRYQGLMPWVTVLITILVALVWTLSWVVIYQVATT